MKTIRCLIIYYLMFLVITSSYAQNDSLFIDFDKAKLQPNKVKILDFWHGGHYSLPDEFADSLFIFPNLTELFISGDRKHFKEFPKGVLKLKQLKKLSLTGHAFASIPKEISQLDNLEELNLSGNQIQTFQPALVKLKKLKSLKINDSRLSQIPKNFSQFKKLTHLELAGCSLTNLPASFSRLRQIEFLDLSSNKFDTLPFCLNQLKSLKELDLESSHIKVIPNGFGNFPHLKKLHLAYNRSICLPKSFSKMKHLEKLDISMCDLEYLPLPITKLSNLKRLAISYNDFLELPTSIRNLKKLEYLDLSYCKMETFPKSIVNLPALEELDFKMNKIKTLPNSISALQSIKKIDLLLNELESLPESIGNLQNLEFIDCSFSSIKEIPTSVSNLTKLKLMDLKYNELRRRPAFIKKMPDSIKINLLGNPFDLDRNEKKERILKTKSHFTDPRDGHVYPTIQINDDTWMCENLGFTTPKSTFDSINPSSYGRKYQKSELNKVCPEGWHSAIASEWKRLFVEIMHEFPSDPEGKDNRLTKKDRKRRGSYDEAHPTFDPYSIRDYSVKWYISDSSFNRIKKQPNYSNFYGLNIQLNKRYRHSGFGAYNTDGEFVLLLYLWYTQFVEERYLRESGEMYFSVRCVKS
jgi:uncharacterized protein (TIGR02145 family)